MGFGYTFNPGADRRDANGRNTEPVNVPQGAIQTLNYALPKFSGNSISPLVSQQQVGSPFSSAVLASVFKTVLGPGADVGSMGSGVGPQDARDTGISSFGQSSPSYLPSSPGPTSIPGPMADPGQYRQPPTNMGQSDAPMLDVPNFGGRSTPRNKDIYGDRYAYEGNSLAHGASGYSNSAPQGPQAPPRGPLGSTTTYTENNAGREDSPWV